jgi:hypothetical protein
MRNWIILGFVVVSFIGIAFAKPKDHNQAAAGQMAPVEAVESGARTAYFTTPVSVLTSYDGGVGDPDMIDQGNEARGQYIVITAKASNVCVCAEPYTDAGSDPGTFTFDSRCSSSTCTCNDSITDGQPVLAGTQRAFAPSGNRVPCVVSSLDAGVVFTAERVIR